MSSLQTTMSEEQHLIEYRIGIIEGQIQEVSDNSTRTAAKVEDVNLAFAKIEEVMKESKDALNRLQDTLDSQCNTIGNLRASISVLQFQAKIAMGMFGAVGAGIIAILVEIFSH